MTKEEYDPKTCITASELREMGIPIPEHIPGCAWMKRSGLKMESGNPNYDPETEELIIHMTVKFTEPMNYITLTVSYLDEKKEEP